jgi:DNA-binding transcriptional regulator YiaG
MKIVIPDSSKDKIRSLRVEMIKYALSIFEFHYQAASYIGVSVRGLRDWRNWYPEISDPTPNYTNGLIIELDDDNTNKLRTEYIQIVKYAVHLKLTKKGAARFIGINVRTLQNWINRYPELEEFKYFNNYANGNELWDKYEDSHLWKTKKIGDEI